MQRRRREVWEATAVSGEIRKSAAGDGCNRFDPFPLKQSDNKRKGRAVSIAATAGRTCGSGRFYSRPGEPEAYAYAARQNLFSSTSVCGPGNICFAERDGKC